MKNKIVSKNPGHFGNCTLSSNFVGISIQAVFYELYKIEKIKLFYIFDITLIFNPPSCFFLMEI